MKPVNTLPSFVSQDTEIKAKEVSSSLGSNSEATDFSLLVERQTQHDKKALAQVEKEAAINGIKHDKGGNERSELNNTQQENESSSLAKHNTHSAGQEAQQKSGQEDEQLKADTNNAEEVPVDDESLHESEQFISMLYNSDKTLATATALKVNAEGSSIQNSGEQINLEKVITTTEENLKQSSVKANEQTINKTGVTGDAEHKLKAFSQEELRIRASEKKEALMAQPNDQFLKEHQKPLKAQDSLSSQQVSAESNLNKAFLSEVVDTVTDTEPEQAATEAQVTNKMTIGTVLGGSENEGRNKAVKLQSEVEAVNKMSAQSIDLNKLTSADTTVVDDANPVNSDTEAKNTKLNFNENQLSKVVKENINVTEKISEKVTDKLVDVLSSEGRDKLSTEAKVMASAISGSLKQEMSTNPLFKTSDKQLLTAGELSRKESQANLLNMSTNELKSAEEIAVDYVEPSLLTEQEISDKTGRVANKTADAFSARAQADISAQHIQLSQASQTNEAYMEFQSSEVLNHTVASDTAQIQKNNIQLQQETISIFRKDFTDAVKDKVMVMINQKIQQFDIMLDPPEFGNMQVRVNLQGEQAAVNFVVQNQQAKEALEQNMHKLKDMLAEQGVDVGGANVEQQNQQENSSELQHGTGKNPAGLAANQQDDEHNVPHILSTNLFDSSASGVDYYA